MGTITEEDQKILRKLKENLTDLDLENDRLLEDIQLIRWLRARNMSIKKAEEMLRNSLKWRDETEISDILRKSVPECIKVEFPFDIVGVDKQGNVLVHIPFGKMDMKKGIKVHGKDEGYQMALYYVEKVFQLALAESAGSPTMKRLSVIIDFQDLSYTQLVSVEVIELILSSLKMFEQNYPEFLGTGFLVNTPAIWYMLWNMAKPFLHQRTQEKCIITGSNPLKVVEILQMYIDPKSLPSKYGGHVELESREITTA